MSRADGAATLRLRSFGHTRRHVTLHRSHQHSAALTRVHWGQSTTHTRSHPLHAQATWSLQPVRAHTRRADAKQSRRGSAAETVGQRTRRHPAIERQTHGSSPGQPDPEQSYSM